MPENINLQGGGAWRLLAEITLPIAFDASERVVTKVVAAIIELHLPETRLRQVREIIVEALASHTHHQAISVRLFIAQSAEPPRDEAGAWRGWGLFSIQKVLEPDDDFDGPILLLEVYFYT